MEKFSAHYQQAIRLMSDKIISRRYSRHTYQIYMTMFKQFLGYCHPKPLNDIGQKEIRAYQYYLVSEKKVSGSYQNQSINAIKFYLEKVCGQDPKFYDLERPVKEEKLPEVLSQKEISAILNSFTNLKHKTIITFIYATGTRISEALSLKLSDIDSENMRVFIKGGKGKKDRITILSRYLLKLLREYYKAYRPKKYLFEGPSGKPYSASSTRKVFQRACKKAGTNRHVTVHTMRHSFGTHLIEEGTNLRYVQTLMGHNSPKTTELYTHVSNKKLSEVRSPLENMAEKGYI